MAKKKPKEYEVKDFKTLCDMVSDKNVTVLSLDLAKWLVSYNWSINQLRNAYPKQTKGKSNTEIASGYFTWIDDGKNDLKDIRIKKD